MACSDCVNASHFTSNRMLQGPVLFCRKVLPTSSVYLSWADEAQEVAQEYKSFGTLPRINPGVQPPLHGAPLRRQHVIYLGS